MDSFKFDSRRDLTCIRSGFHKLVWYLCQTSHKPCERRCPFPHMFPGIPSSQRRYALVELEKSATGFLLPFLETTNWTTA